MGAADRTPFAPAPAFLPSVKHVRARSGGLNRLPRYTLMKIFRW